MLFLSRTLLFSHCESTEEGTRNVVAECLGKLTLVDPLRLLPQLKVCDNIRYNRFGLLRCIWRRFNCSLQVSNLSFAIFPIPIFPFPIFLPPIFLFPVFRFPVFLFLSFIFPYFFSHPSLLLFSREKNKNLLSFFFFVP